MDIKLFPLERINKQIWSDLNSSIDQLVAESRFILGQPVSELEDSLARYVGAAEAVCVGNGTDALELVFDILGLQRGDQVIIPAFGYISAAEMAARRGLDIIWCDVDERLQYRRRFCCVSYYKENSSNRVYVSVWYTCKVFGVKGANQRNKHPAYRRWCPELWGC